MSALIDLVRAFASILPFASGEDSPSKPDAHDASLEWDYTSSSSTALLARWVAADIHGNLDQVPFVGEQTIRVLKRANIHSSFQLLGAFYMVCRPGMTPSEICSTFQDWLGSLGVHASLVKRITDAVAAKAHTLLPTIGKQ
jgi:hypothetical protein